MQPDRSPDGRRHRPSGSDGSASSVAAVLARIVAEVDSRGPEGHWLSKTCPLMAQARLALLEERAAAEKTFGEERRR